MHKTWQERSRAALALLLLVSCPALSGGQTQTKSDASAAKRGRALYTQYCVSCHGSSAKGDGPAASALKAAPADLTDIAKRYNGFPEEKVMDFIDGEKYAVGHGSREMPVWGKRLRRGQRESQSDVYALTRYLASIQK